MEGSASDVVLEQANQNERADHNRCRPLQSFGRLLRRHRCGSHHQRPPLPFWSSNSVRDPATARLWWQLTFHPARVALSPRPEPCFQRCRFIWCMPFMCHSKAFSGLSTTRPNVAQKHKGTSTASGAMRPSPRSPSETDDTSALWRSPVCAHEGC